MELKHKVKLIWVFKPSFSSYNLAILQYFLHHCLNAASDNTFTNKNSYIIASSRDACVRELELRLAAAPRTEALERLEAELRAAHAKLTTAPQQQQLDRWSLYNLYPFYNVLTKFSLS